MKNEKTPDDPGAELGGDVGDAAHPIQLRSERRVQPDLADRRANGRHAHPRAVERPAESAQLDVAEVGDVRGPYAAQLQIRDGLRREHRELLVEAGRDLVREPAEREGHPAAAASG
jgi:hypothetical protein